MPVFTYIGFNTDGRNVTGTIEAPTKKRALDALSGDGILPATIQAAGLAAASQEGASPAAVKGRVPLSVRTLFVRELATFLNTDIPLLEAIDVLRRQETNPAFRAVLNDVHDHVQSGESFSRALGRHPRLFPTLLVSMVRVGETGGMLGQVLEQMAVWMEHDEEVRGEIRGALAYPAMIVMLGIVTVFILLTYVLPRITSIFSGMESELPLPTKVLMFLSDFMFRRWWLVLLGIAVTVVVIGLLLKQPAGRRVYDRLALNAPLFGKLARKAAIARFTRATSALLNTGVPLLEALRVVRDLLGNVLLAEMIDRTIERVTRGQSLSKSLGESPWFPHSVVHLLGVGERTGRLSEMFERVAQMFEKQTRAQIKILLNLLSPLLIIALAVVVALIAVAILLPIFQMSQTMR